MKRTLFFLTLVLSFSFASAQIIPFVGGNLSWYQVQGDNTSTKPVRGVNAGAVANIHLSSMFSWQAGLQYTLTGGRIITTHPGNPYLPTDDYLFRLHTLQLPVMLLLNTGDEDKRHLFAGAGFYVAANLAGTRDVQSSTTYLIDQRLIIVPEHYKQSLQFREQGRTYRPFDFGLNVGLGYRLSNGIEFYGFFQKGYTDIQASSYALNDRTYQAGVSVRYALKLRKQKTGPKKAGS